MIRLEHVSKTFDSRAGNVHAVQDVTLTIQDKEIYGIIGFSGAGKSTLVRCINLLERPSRGAVVIDDQDITKMKDKELRAMRKKIGMIFQHFNLMRSRTVYQNIAFPLKGSGLSKAEMDQKIRRLLELVDLSDKVDAYPSQLSGGQKQRVAIARALANDPNVVEEGSIIDIFSKPQAEVTRNFIASTSNAHRVQEMLDAGASVTRLEKGQRMVKLNYDSVSTSKALISEISRRFLVDTNIIFGNVEIIKNTPLGDLIVILSGEEAHIDQALAYLKAHEVGVEVMKSC